MYATVKLSNRCMIPEFYKSMYFFSVWYLVNYFFQNKTLLFDFDSCLEKIFANRASFIGSILLCFEKVLSRNDVYKPNKYSQNLVWKSRF